MIDRQNERPQCWHTGGVLFLFDSRKLNPEVDYRLNLIVQPFANVVANHTRHDRNQESKYKIHVRTPFPLRGIGRQQKDYIIEGLSTASIARGYPRAEIYSLESKQKAARRPGRQKISKYHMKNLKHYEGDRESPKQKAYHLHQHRQ